MTNERPYRPARTAAEALAELRLGAGVKYDPCLVAVFATVVGDAPQRATRAIQ
jgi:HD-GYP domain-containing protein (c-di-GMP phosphodiesterase class II)